MAVPKSRHCKSRRDRRRAHLALENINTNSCPKCGKPVLTHRVCQACGYYKGKMVIDVMAKLEKTERKKKEREIAAKEREGAKKEALDLKKLSKKS